MEETDFSATEGRNVNRIGKEHFVINGKEYQIDKNDNDKNNLHSSFEESGLNMMAGVDLEPSSREIGGGKSVYPMNRLESFCRFLLVQVRKMTGNLSHQRKSIQR